MSMGGAQASAGEDVPQIDTEQLSFQPISGDDKLRLLPSPWPASNQPPASASLLSIASGKGLIAAAGPDTLVVAKTQTVRSAFRDARANEEDISSEGVVREYRPEARLSIPRISQVAFSSDESCLVISAEQGGGLAVYDTNAITSGGKDAAFQVGTNGVSVKQLLPNPNSDANSAHLFGIVLETGQLLLADLKEKALKNSSNGNAVFHENVCCAAWSRLGKQFVAGRKDGTAVQIDQQGNVKAEIPVPPKLPELSNGATRMPLNSIYWLDTNDFLLVHTPEAQQSGDEMSDMPAESILHLARRENPKSNNWQFQNIMDPTPAFATGSRSGAAHYFMQRLKDWPPNLDELLMLISTGSTDVGMLTKSKTPLDTTNPVMNTFAVTQCHDDAARAGMPLSILDNSSDTSPIGIAVDLSVTEKIQKPIAKDEEIDQSPVPLPALYILNHEGMLRVWYIVYNDSVRQKQAYPDLIAAGGPRPLGKDSGAAPSSAPSSGGMAPSSAFGSMTQQTAQATPPAKPAFGQASTPAFGQASTPAFGQASTPFGAKQGSVWGSQAAGTSPGPKAPAFGQSAFGQASTPGGGGGGAFGKPAFGQASTPSTFGQTGGLGKPQNLWGAPPQKSPTASQPPSTPFGANTAQSSPFAAFGQKKDGEQKPASGSLFGGGGQGMSTFGGLGAAKTGSTPSFLGSKPGETSFASTATIGSSFGGGSTVGGFGTPSQNGSAGTFGKASALASREETMGDEETAFKTAEEKKSEGGLFGSGNGFKLGSTFKGDGSAKDDLPKPANPGASLFGSGFGSALGEVEQKKQAPVTPIKQEPGTDVQPRLQDIPDASTTPKSAPKNEPSAQMPKRLFGDVPPMDVPGGGGAEEKKGDPPAQMPKRMFGDVPPVDVPGGEVPKRRAGDVPPVDVPGGEEKVFEQPKKEEEAPLAGSPPIDLGNERFSEAAGSEEDLPPGPEDEDEEDWDEEDEEEDGENEEGEDEEAEGEEEEVESDHEVTDPKGLDEFMKRVGQPRSPQAPPKLEESTTPATERKPIQQSFTPAGFPNPPQLFQPKAQESPRSPSPQRSVTAPMQKMAFGQAAKPPTSSLYAHTSKPNAVPPAEQKQPQRISVPAAKLAPPERSTARSPSAQPTAGELEDEEAAQIQTLLASEPQPRKDVPNFLAHQNYVGHSDKDGIGGSMERLYRDVNSMIDTLGLNAHALRGFVRGQDELKLDGDRTEEDLDAKEEWTLDEVDQVADVLDQVGGRLHGGKIEDVRRIIEQSQAQAKETQQLRLRFGDLRKRIRAQTDAGQVASQLAAPLPAETQAQQAELRQGVQSLQKLLGEVEEAMSMLRAELASVEQVNGVTKGKTNVPTMEAVTNTILKMTAIIEKKSGDIDVLESQMRRLPGGIASLNLKEDYEDQLVASLTGSKFLNGSAAHTPPTSRSRMLANGDAPGMNGMLGSRLRTPPSSASGRRSLMFSPSASRLGMSTGGVHGSARKKMVDVTEEEVRAYRSKTGRRRGVMDELRDEVEKRGVRTVRLEG